MKPHPVLVAAALFALAACKPQQPVSPTATSKAEPAPAADTAADAASVDGWIGRWVGPEGTALELGKLGDGYDIKITSLDGPASFKGTAAGDRIDFERSGRTESIRATDGAGTGMKWLAEKKDCLVIQPSEGFCRD